MTSAGMDYCLANLRFCDGSKLVGKRALLPDRSACRRWPPESRNTIDNACGAEPRRRDPRECRCPMSTLKNSRELCRTEALEGARISTTDRNTSCWMCAQYGATGEPKS